MFQTLQNAFSIEFTLVPEGPVLVRAQSVGLDPGLADMEFQRTSRNGKRTVFLAGSGLKGVIRSHVERLLRSAGRFACDPTDTRNEASCGHNKRRLGQGTGPERPHAGQCGACFTFGSLKLAGRFRIGDAFPVDDVWDETNLTEVRAGVGIERKSQGAASSVLYDAEVVVRGGFSARMTGENFSLWQAAVILQALADLDDGFVQIGGCKSRGMGTVKVHDPRLVFRFLNQDEGFLTGAQKEKGLDYCLPENDRLEVQEPSGQEGGSVKKEHHGIFRSVTYSGAAVAQLRRQLMAGPFREYVSDSEVDGD